MNLNLPAVVMFVVGVVLVYAAVKDNDPRDVVLKSLGKPEKFGSLSGTYGTLRKLPTTAPSSSPDLPPTNGGVWV